MGNLYQENITLINDEFELDTEGVEQAIIDYLDKKFDGDMEEHGYSLTDIKFRHEGEPMLFNIESEIGYVDDGGYDVYVNLYTEYGDSRATESNDNIMNINKAGDWLINAVIESYRATED